MPVSIPRRQALRLILTTCNSHPGQRLPGPEVSQQLGHARASPVPSEGNGSHCLSSELYINIQQIFYTGENALAGQEEPFPAPDNNSKMRRSVENAAHIGKSGQSSLMSRTVLLTPIFLAGLFAPGGGQNPRHEQRRRRSQFDRGTRLAQIEEQHGYLPQAMRGLNLLGNGPATRAPLRSPVNILPIGTRPQNGLFHTNNIREGASAGPRFGN